MRDKERIIIIISILPLFLMTGCISSRTIPEREKVQYYTIPALSNEILDKRIYEIKNLLKENSLSDDRKETAISILKVYEKLKSLNEGALTEKQSRKTIKLLFDTLVKIEQQYFYNGIVSGDAAGQIIIENYSALKKQMPVSLAVSLHAPNDELRNELVPLNKKYPIAPLSDLRQGLGKGGEFH